MHLYRLYADTGAFLLAFVKYDLLELPIPRHSRNLAASLHLTLAQFSTVADHLKWLTELPAKIVMTGTLRQTVKPVSINAPSG